MDVKLDTIITSKIRLRIMFKFFINSQTTGYLRGLEKELGDSTNAIRAELNRFEKAGLLIFEIIQNRKYFRANINHPFFNDLNSMLKKSVGINLITKCITDIDKRLEAAWVTGDIAKGIDSKIIDLVIIGNNFDNNALATSISKVQMNLNRRIRYIVLTDVQMNDYFKNKPAFCIWEKNGSL